MAQASNVIAFPGSEKIAFKALKIDAKKILTKYDEHRHFVYVAVELLSKSPAALKKSCARIAEAGSAIEVDAVERLITDFEELSKDFHALGEMLDSSAARLTAAHRGLV